MEINLVCGTNFHLIENFITEIKNNNNFEFERIDAQKKAESGIVF